MCLFYRVLQKRRGLNRFQALSVSLADRRLDGADFLSVCSQHGASAHEDFFPLDGGKERMGAVRAPSCSPHEAQRNAGNTISPDSGAARLHPGYIFMTIPWHVARTSTHPWEKL